VNFSRASVAIASLLLFAVASADTVTKELEANYAAITSAFQHKDIAPIAKFMAPGFVVHLDSGQSMTRDRVLSDYKKQMGMMKDVSWTRKVTTVTPAGGAFVATVEGNVKGMVTGPDKKPHKLNLIASARDTWQKKGKSWILLTTTILKRTATVDGKPLKMPGTK